MSFCMIFKSNLIKSCKSWSHQRKDISNCYSLRLMKRDYNKSMNSLVNALKCRNNCHFSSFNTLIKPNDTSIEYMLSLLDKCNHNSQDIEEFVNILIFIIPSQFTVKSWQFLDSQIVFHLNSIKSSPIASRSSYNQWFLAIIMRLSHHFIKISSFYKISFKIFQIIEIIDEFISFQRLERSYGDVIVMRGIFKPDDRCIENNHKNQMIFSQIDFQSDLNMISSSTNRYNSSNSSLDDINALLRVFGHVLEFLYHSTSQSASQSLHDETSSKINEFHENITNKTFKITSRPNLIRDISSTYIYVLNQAQSHSRSVDISSYESLLEYSAHLGLISSYYTFKSLFNQVYERLLSLYPDISSDVYDRKVTIREIHSHHSHPRKTSQVLKDTTKTVDINDKDDNIDINCHLHAHTSSSHVFIAQYPSILVKVLNCMNDSKYRHSNLNDLVFRIIISRDYYLSMNTSELLRISMKLNADSKCIEAMRRINKSMNVYNQRNSIQSEITGNISIEPVQCDNSDRNERIIYDNLIWTGNKRSYTITDLEVALQSFCYDIHEKKDILSLIQSIEIDVMKSILIEKDCQLEKIVNCIQLYGNMGRKNTSKHNKLI